MFKVLWFVTKTVNFGSLLFLPFGLVFADQAQTSTSETPKNLASYKVVACEKYLIADRLSAALAYNDLVNTLGSIDSKNGHVLLLRGGRGEFALQNSKPGSIRRHALAIPVYHPHFYFQLSPVHNEAAPISAAQFREALNWRHRPKEKLTVAKQLTRTAQAFLGNDQNSIDPVHGRSFKHDYLMQMVWRYTMNSVSEESYNLVKFLIRKKTFDADNLLVAVDIDVKPRNIRLFIRRIWQQAAEIGYPLKLDENEYLAEELEQILASYNIAKDIVGEGQGHRMTFYWNQKIYHFVHEWSENKHFVYRRVRDLSSGI